MFTEVGSWKEGGGRGVQPSASPPSPQDTPPNGTQTSVGHPPGQGGGDHGRGADTPSPPPHSQQGPPRSAAGQMGPGAGHPMGPMMGPGPHVRGMMPPYVGLFLATLFNLICNIKRQAKS